MSTQTSYSDFSGLATFASRGLTALTGIEMDIDPTAGVDAGIRLCSMLISAERHSTQRGSVRVDTDAGPVIQYAVGLLSQDLPPGVVERLAREAEQATKEMEKLASDNRALSTERLDELAELFARFAIVLRDYGL